jgi:hypothetical protein
MSTVYKAIPALLVASLGALLAWLWLVVKIPPAGPVAIAGGVALLGLVLRVAGRSIARRNPTTAVLLLEAWAVTILSVGSLVAGLVVVIAVWLANQTPTGTPEENKQVITAFLTGLTAFLAASFIKGFEDFDALIASSVKGDLQKAYSTCPYPDESAPWKALHATYAPGATGWGLGARRARARILAANSCPVGV